MSGGFAAGVMVLLGAVAGLAPGGANAEAGERSITFAGAAYDRPDLLQLGLGRAGHWFPQFGASEPVSGRPTGENVRAALPGWVAPLNHAAGLLDLGCAPAEIVEGCLPTFLFRSFSQDGPARSAGGQPGWSTLRLPDGEVGRSGAIVDPHTRGNTNNTINRIQLRGDVPATFRVSVVTDNTAQQHDPAEAFVARGNAGPLDTDLTQIEPASEPAASDLAFNGIADVYTFRVAGFRAGDYLKLRLAGDASAPGGASFGGLLFDEGG
ncbi:MAG: hypothetical protein WD844_14445 [Thermoleophilaceae bacterium]